MKCANCGFISNRDFFRCPYCGHIHEEANEGIRTRINIGHDISMQVRTILIIISLNLFGVALLADWYFGFQYSLSLWAFILIFLPLTIVDIATSRRKSLIIALEKIDLFIVPYLNKGKEYIQNVVAYFDSHYEKAKKDDQHIICMYCRYIKECIKTIMGGFNGWKKMK